MSKKTTWNILKYGRELEPLSYRILKTPYNRYMLEYRLSLFGFKWWHNYNWIEQFVPSLLLWHSDKYFYDKSDAKSKITDIADVRKKKHQSKYTVEEEGAL
jgi:hypothetical protein